LFNVLRTNPWFLEHVDAIEREPPFNFSNPSPQFKNHKAIIIPTKPTTPTAAPLTAVCAAPPAELVEVVVVAPTPAPELALLARELASEAAAEVIEE